MPYVAAKWVLETKKSPKRDGYAIVALDDELKKYFDLTKIVATETIPIKLLSQKINKHKKRIPFVDANNETRTKIINTPEYVKSKKIARKYNLVYCQDQTKKKSPFIAIKFPQVWRKKHISNFLRLLPQKSNTWVKFTLKQREVVLAEYSVVTLVDIQSIQEPVSIWIPDA